MDEILYLSFSDEVSKGRLSAGSTVSSHSMSSIQSSGDHKFFCPICDYYKDKGPITFRGILNHIQKNHLQDNECIIPLDKGLAFFMHQNNCWLCSKCQHLATSKTNARSKCKCKVNYSVSNLSHLGGFDMNVEQIRSVDVPVSLLSQSEVSSEPLSFCALTGLSFDEILKKIRLSQVVTVKSIPKKCRSLYCSIVTTLLNQIISDPKNIEYHILYEMFPKCVLSKLYSTK